MLNLIYNIMDLLISISTQIDADMRELAEIKSRISAFILKDAQICIAQEAGLEEEAGAC
jgi:hypothetical protein